MKRDTQNAREQGRIILAHGEVTGHCHEVVTDTGLPPGMDAAQFFTEPNGTRTLIVLAPCTLRHEEHAPIALSPSDDRQFAHGDLLLVPKGPGCWTVIQQQQWTLDRVRAVRD